MRVSSTARTLQLCMCICLYPLVFGESVSENVNTTTEYFISKFCSAQSKGSGNETNSEGFTSLHQSFSTLVFCSLKERLSPEWMPNNVNKSSLTPVLRFWRTVFRVDLIHVNQALSSSPAQLWQASSSHTDDSYSGPCHSYQTRPELAACRFGLRQGVPCRGLRKERWVDMFALSRQ